MGETVEKIYCCNRDNNDNALAAAILANGNNRRDDWGPMAAMMGECQWSTAFLDCKPSQKVYGKPWIKHS